MTEKLKLQSQASFQREILITVIQVKRNDYYVWPHHKMDYNFCDFKLLIKHLMSWKKSIFSLFDNIFLKNELEHIIWTNTIWQPCMFQIYIYVWIACIKKNKQIEVKITDNGICLLFQKYVDCLTSI